MENFHTFIVSPEEEKTRLDILLVRKDLPLSRTRIQHLIKDGLIRVNKRSVNSHHRVKANELIEVIIPIPSPPKIKGEHIPIEIIYEDETLIVVNKPAGMVVHPACGNYSGTLINALLAHCRNLSGIGGENRPGLVHRLDKETSGLMVVAKDDYTHRDLQRQWQKREIKRHYLALVKGEMKSHEGVIELPIGRHPKDRKRMWVNRLKGKKAITEYKVMDRFTVKSGDKLLNFSLLRLSLKTGRTHQIRVHMAYMKTPIVRDEKYGRKVKCLNLVGSDKSLNHVGTDLSVPIRGMKGMALHAATLGFFHPKTREFLEFNAPPPDYFQSLLTELRRQDKISSGFKGANL